jgi:hypothetical protein
MFVVADGDGVVVVPRERAMEVADAALPFLDNIGRDGTSRKGERIRGRLASPNERVKRRQPEYNLRPAADALF